MVQKGQFLERPALVPVGRRLLEGLWHRGEKPPAALLVPPRPGAGSMDAPALNDLAHAFSVAGHPSLRFNFGGVGASQGRSRDLAAQVREARAAARHLRASAGFRGLLVVAFRSGAEVAVRLAKEADRLVLVSPPAGLDLGRLAACEAPVLFVLAEGEAGRARWAEHCAQTGDRLEVVEEADPAWNRGLPQMARAAVAFAADARERP